MPTEFIKTIADLVRLEIEITRRGGTVTKGQKKEEAKLIFALATDPDDLTLLLGTVEMSHEEFERLKPKRGRSLLTLRAYKSASVAALFVAKAGDPTRFFMVWRPDAGADTWRVEAATPERVPADRERLSVTAPELSKGFFVALNEFFSSTVAIQ